MLRNFTLLLCCIMCTVHNMASFSSSLISSFTGTLLRYCLSDLRWFQLLQLLPVSYYYYYYMALSTVLLGHVLSVSEFSRQLCCYVKHPQAQTPNGRPGYHCFSNSYPVRYGWPCQLLGCLRRLSQNSSWGEGGVGGNWGKHGREKK